MAQHVRRRMASIQLSAAAGALGLLAGIGLGRGTQPTPTVDAEPAANKTLTINGSNIVDGSIKYQDLNKASIQKGIYLKAQVDRLFLKLSDADARFHKIITSALGDYIKLGDADTRFVKLDALNGYLKLTDADARFLKLDALNGYLKLTDADARFLKLDALSNYVKLDALNDYLKLDDANALIEKQLGGYLKTTDADARYVQGDGSVRTGSQLVGADARPLLEVPKALAVSAAKEGSFAHLTLTNLTEGDLNLSSSVKDPNGGDQGGVIPKGGSRAILIGLLQPATVQVVPADGSSVHTFSFSAFSAAGGLRVVGQALSGAPPAAG